MLGALLALVVVGVLGWRLVAGSPAPAATMAAPAATTGGGPAEAGTVVELADGAGVDLRMLGWQRNPDGSASAVLTLRNVGSSWTEFIVDVAAVDDAGQHIYGYGTAKVSPLAPGTLGVLTPSIPNGVPADARVGVANVWGRTAGDPQIHPLNFAPASPTTSAAPTASAAPTGSAAPAAPTASATGTGWAADSGGAAGAPRGEWSETQLMAAASQFAASLSAMQANCRSDPSLAGLVCLSRRNFPDYLLADGSRPFVQGTPFFHQEADPTGPPRAFQLRAPGEALACVGQRIDKQTSDQVAILGSCSQRGLYPGDGTVRHAVGSSMALPPVPSGAVPGTSVGTGGLPGEPVAATNGGPASTRPPAIGDSVALGSLVVRVDGVQVGITDVPGLAAPQGAYTLVTLTLTNRGSAPVALGPLTVAVSDAAGDALPLVGATDGSTRAWPPQPVDLAPGQSASTTIALDLATNQTAAVVTTGVPATGEQAVISLLPPLS